MYDYNDNDFQQLLRHDSGNMQDRFEISRLEQIVEI